MISEKANALCILNILHEYSDEEHIMQMKDIIDRMNKDYGLNPDRRTIYGALALLLDMRYDISVYEENGKGYFLRSRELERSEVLLLTDAIYSFPFITAGQTNDLVSKIQKQLSVHQRKKYKHLTIAKTEKKGDNKQVFLNIELLDEAISEKKKVRFGYYSYNIRKEMELRRAEPYIVNPFRMVYMNDHYYLLCKTTGKDGVSFYRIDRMKDISILDDFRDEKIPDEEEIKNVVYAFTGKAEQIKMRCDREILNDVIDKFGKDIFLQHEGDKEILVTFKAPPKGVKFWALQYLPYVEVLEPVWLRNEVIESIGANRYSV